LPPLKRNLTNANDNGVAWLWSLSVDFNVKLTKLHAPKNVKKNIQIHNGWDSSYSSGQFGKNPPFMHY
jgi:hypothetical protein